MRILAIETSCDETAVAIIEENKIIFNLVASQIDFHAKYGGVIPEMASRMHAEKINYLLKEANQKSSLDKVDYFAYTEKPGLIGALQIGTIAAQALSIRFQKPAIPINHLHGHIFAANIDHHFVFPLLALVVSGGHSQIVLVTENLDFKIVTQTCDDAVGEVFDKIARILGFPYPGGPFIEKLSQKGIAKFNFPIAMPHEDQFFSFSGLKSAVSRFVIENSKVNKFDLAASFQKAAIEALMLKFKKRILKYRPKMAVLAGGVAANKVLRQKFQSLDLKVAIPQPDYCTDNAAMIAKFCQIKLLQEKK